MKNKLQSIPCRLNSSLAQKDCRRRYQMLQDTCTLMKMKDNQPLGVFSESKNSYIWKKMNYPTTETLGKRHGHKVVRIGTRVYGFGGSIDCSSGESTNDFFSYDLATDIYLKLESCNMPEERSSFDMMVGPSEDSIFLVGGINNSGICSDIWSYDIKRNSWSLITNFNASEIFLCVYGRSICFYNESLVLYGGCAGPEIFTDAVFLFDLSCCKHKKVTTWGQKPAPRYQHQSVIIQNQMFMFGGGNPLPLAGEMDVFVLDLVSSQWTKLRTKGVVPSSRAAHTCAVDDYSGLIFLFGGFSVSLEKCDSLYSFHPVTFEWNFILNLGKENPSPTAFHSSVMHSGVLYIFGGTNDENQHCGSWFFETLLQPQKLMVLAARTLLNDDPAASSRLLPSEVKSGLKSMSQYSKYKSKYFYWSCCRLQ